jgi:hypothetical protein
MISYCSDWTSRAQALAKVGDGQIDHRVGPGRPHRCRTFRPQNSGKHPRTHGTSGLDRRMPDPG